MISRCRLVSIAAGRRCHPRTLAAFRVPISSRQDERRIPSSLSRPLVCPPPSRGSFSTKSALQEETDGGSKTTGQSGGHCNVEKPKETTEEAPKQRWGLREFTLVASFLCAVDCTVFPAILAVVGTAELLSPENIHWVHELSHKAALWIVMPIGTTTTISNHLLHKNSLLTAASTLGLSMILGSNVHMDWVPEAIDSALHQTRLYNTVGCGMLITSSYLGHKLYPDHHDEPPSCHAPNKKKHEEAQKAVDNDPKA